MFVNNKLQLFVLLPHKGLAAGKSRLSSLLNDTARSELNHWLLARTLRVVSTWLGDAQRCVLVSPCLDALALARETGAVALHEHPHTRGLNAALSQAAVHAATLGAQRLLILPCDLPRLDGAALESMMAEPVSGNAVVVASDRRAEGTNALLVDAQTRKFAFGKNSRARHVELAEARGLRAFRCSNPALAFDLDTVEDFSEWLRSGDALPDFLAARSLPA